MLCYKEEFKVELAVDHAMANFERSYGCMISAVVYMPLRLV